MKCLSHVHDSAAGLTVTTWSSGGTIATLVEYPDTLILTCGPRGEQYAPKVGGREELRDWCLRLTANTVLADAIMYHLYAEARYE